MMSKNTRKNRIWPVITVLILVGVVAFVLVRAGREDGVSSDMWGRVSWGEDETEAEDVSFETSTWATYSDDGYNFSLEYPSTFTTARLDEGESTVVIFQNASAHQGFQIYITEIDETFDMTAERIRQDIPDMELRDPQPVLLGENAGQGLAFMSDNEAFGGDSREVWFVFNDVLYQISTYASLDTLLQEVMGTWEFK